MNADDAILVVVLRKDYLGAPFRTRLLDELEVQPDTPRAGVACWLRLELRPRATAFVHVSEGIHLHPEPVREVHREIALQELHADAPVLFEAISEDEVTRCYDVENDG